MSTHTETEDSTDTSSPRQNGRQYLIWFAKKLVPAALLVTGGLVLIFLAGLAQRIGWLPREQAATASASPESGAIYTCPMHPQIRQPQPGRCPICGMPLVAATSGATDLNSLSIKIEPAQRRLANIQTAKVKSGPVEATLQTVGAIAIDESRQSTIAAYIDGRLERLFADYTGVEIKKGDHLAVIYSPQLYGAQVEYIEARRASNNAAGLPAVRQAQQALSENTLQRLREFGMTDEQLKELEDSDKAESRLTIYSPQAGTVVEKLVVEGNYVKAGDPIYRIAELSTVWLMLKLFPEDATRIRYGQRVEAAVQSLPGEKLLGRVAFIDPTVDPQTRTVGIRAELLNEDRRLRPGDYAEASITMPIGPQGKVYDEDLANKWISPMHPQIIRTEPGQCPICGMDLVPASRYGFTSEPIAQQDSLYVPRSAVLMAGRNSVVYVETKPGVFEIRPVTLGPILRDRIVILDGLKAGEDVATSGNFLIDSQMQLAGKPSLIDPTRALARKGDRRDGPLVFDKISVTSVGGETGAALEQLYAAYFSVQKALASDKKPDPAAAQTLHQSARTLAQNPAFPEGPKKILHEVATLSEHLHHVDVAEARQQFKPISHAVVTLATQVRSDRAENSFTHFYCPMVPDGGGDWLQPDGELLNPYFGSEMLRCGEKVQELPAKGRSTPQKEIDPGTVAAPPGKGDG